MVDVVGIDEEFFKRLDAAVVGLLEERDAHGHPDLSGYLPHMGPRYGFPGKTVPLSVFRGEGRALYLIARTLRPAVTAECFTGTGYSAVCLAAGWPDGVVYTVDDCSEGGVGDLGHDTAYQLVQRLGLDNVILVRGPQEDLLAVMNDPEWEAPLRADLYFSDGPYLGFDGLKSGAVTMRQDDGNGRVLGRSFVLKGSSHFSVTCPTVEQRDALAAMVAELMPVELA